MYKYIITIGADMNIFCFPSELNFQLNRENIMDHEDFAYFIAVLIAKHKKSVSQRIIILKSPLFYTNF